MAESNVSYNPDSATSSYLYEALLPENVFGHTKKVRLFRESIERTRSVNKKSSLRILDIGCGSGHAVTRFLGKTEDHVIGIDMHPPNVAYAEKHFGHLGLRFSCIDAQELSSTGEVFDVVVLADVLEHLDDPSSILKMAVDLLAPDGRLLVTVPNGRGPFEIESALSRVPLLGTGLLKLTDLFVALLNKTVMSGAWSRVAASIPRDLPYNIDSGHVQFFSTDDMCELFQSAGLVVTKSGNVSFLSGPFTNYLFAPFRRFCDWNVNIVDRLPRSIASSWFFECSRLEGED
jgi:SAM-dependent methyltransferase